jgi:hypothetical protein
VSGVASWEGPLLEKRRCEKTIFQDAAADQRPNAACGEVEKAVGRGSCLGFVRSAGSRTLSDGRWSLQFAPADPLLQVVGEAGPEHFHLHLRQAAQVELPQSQFAFDPGVAELDHPAASAILILLEHSVQPRNCPTQAKTGLEWATRPYWCSRCTAVRVRSQSHARAISAGSMNKMYADRMSHWNSGMFREYSRLR